MKGYMINVNAGIQLANYTNFLTQSIHENLPPTLRSAQLMFAFRPDSLVPDTL